MNILGDFFRNFGAEIASGTYEHIGLTVTAMACAACIAIPTGIYLSKSRHPQVVSIVLGIVNVIQPVPSLALIAFIVALFNLIGMPTIGPVPGIVSLVAYSLLPILRNTYTGIRQVDPAVTEVARGMGMTTGQILFAVELPLALPVIMAGVRIATVWTIGVATLVSLVGAGGLGDLIFKGLRSYHIDYVLAGAIPAAALALCLDWLLGWLERKLKPAETASEPSR
jgi:osmoprotectant transport system permease protein